MRNKKLKWVAVPLFLLVSCSSSKFYTSSKAYAVLEIPLLIHELSIVDKRQHLSSETDIQLPFISQPGQRITHYPKLLPAYEEIIRKTIEEHLAPDTLNTWDVTVELLTAEKEFSANGWSEKELVRITLQLTLVRGDEKILIKKSGSYYRKTADATNKNFEKLYRKGLREVSYEAMYALKEIMLGTLDTPN
jgi:hemin uptake protein HemP